MECFTFAGPLSRPLGPKPNDFLPVLIEASFPPTLLAISLDCGDPTSPFIMMS